jgi:hypothetical protein
LATTADFSQNKEFLRLKDQTDEMLKITPDSFVIVYSRNGFVVVPASSISGLSKSAQLYSKPVDRFFKEFLMCFIGDPGLKAWDDKTLENLRMEYRARRAIMLYVRESLSQ